MLNCIVQVKRISDLGGPADLYYKSVTLTVIKLFVILGHDGINLLQ